MGWREVLGLAKATGGSVSLSGPAVPFNLPVKKPSRHQTPADRLDWLCKKHKATYERRVRGDGVVVVRLLMDGGDTVISGTGSSTGAAVQSVFEKLEVPK